MKPPLPKTKLRLLSLNKDSQPSKQENINKPQPQSVEDILKMAEEGIATIDRSLCRDLCLPTNN